METVNDLIVALVTASNDAGTLENGNAVALIDAAIRQITDLRGARSMPDSGDLIRLERASADADTLTADDWQGVLRHAADMLRELQPAVDTERALPAYKPDGGDGGNY